MSEMKCYWEHTGDGEFITDCNNEYYCNEFDNEEILQPMLFIFCPYCGKKIKQKTEEN